MLGFRMLSPQCSFFARRCVPVRSLRNEIAPNSARASLIREFSLYFHRTCRAQTRHTCHHHFACKLFPINRLRTLSFINRGGGAHHAHLFKFYFNSSISCSPCFSFQLSTVNLFFQLSPFISHFCALFSRRIFATPAISAACALFAPKDGGWGCAPHESAHFGRDCILLYAGFCCQKFQNVTRLPWPEMPLPQAAAPSSPALQPGRPRLPSPSASLPTIHFARRSSDAPILCRLSSRAVHPRPCTLPRVRFAAASSVRSVRRENSLAMFRSAPLHIAAALSRQDSLPSLRRSPGTPRCCFAAAQILPALAIAREPWETTTPSREIRRRATFLHVPPLAPRALLGVVVSAAAKSSRPVLAQAVRPLAGAREPIAAGLVPTESAAALPPAELASLVPANPGFSAVAAVRPCVAAEERTASPTQDPLVRAILRLGRVAELRLAAELAPADSANFVQPDAPTERPAVGAAPQTPPPDSRVPSPRVFHRK